MISRTSRKCIAVAAVGCFALSFESEATPVAEPSSVIVTAQTHRSKIPGSLARVSVARDPFDDSELSNVTQHHDISSCAAASCDAAPQALREMPRIAALITGVHPSALIENDGERRVITIGDIVNGAAVTAIAPNGVELANGTQLPISRASRGESFERSNDLAMPSIPTAGLPAGEPPSQKSLRSLDERSP